MRCSECRTQVGRPREKAKSSDAIGLSIFGDGATPYFRSAPSGKAFTYSNKSLYSSVSHLKPLLYPLAVQYTAFLGLLAPRCCGRIYNEGAWTTPRYFVALGNGPIASTPAVHTRLLGTTCSSWFMPSLPELGGACEASSDPCPGLSLLLLTTPTRIVGSDMLQPTIWDASHLVVRMSSTLRRCISRKIYRALVVKGTRRGTNANESSMWRLRRHSDGALPSTNGSSGLHWHLIKSLCGCMKGQLAECQ